MLKHYNDRRKPTSAAKPVTAPKMRPIPEHAVKAMRRRSMAARDSDGPGARPEVPEQASDRAREATSKTRGPREPVTSASRRRQSARPLPGQASDEARQSRMRARERARVEGMAQVPRGLGLTEPTDMERRDRLRWNLSRQD